MVLLCSALCPALNLLAVPDGGEVHLYNCSTDEPVAHTRCVLRSEASRENALHASWGPSWPEEGGRGAEEDQPLLAIAWPTSLALWRIKGVAGGGFTVHKVRYTQVTIRRQCGRSACVTICETIVRLCS